LEFGIRVWIRETIRIRIIKIRVRISVRVIGLSLKYKRIQNYKSLKIVTLPKM
jgi:hypothetical protein